MSSWEELTLENVAGGTVAVHFGRCLDEVKADLANAEKIPHDRRTITIKIEFSPGEDPMAPIGVAVVGETKLAKRLPSLGGAMWEKDRLLAYRMTQGELFEPFSVPVRTVPEEE